MKYLIIILLLCQSTISAGQQALTEQVKDSLGTVICHMLREDQDMRSENFRDSLSDAPEQVSSRMRQADSLHFMALQGIIRNYGYPGLHFLGRQNLLKTDGGPVLPCL